MAVVLLRVTEDGQRRATRITDELAYKQHFLPLCARLDLPILASALQGVRLAPGDIPLLRDEFLRLRHHVSRQWFLKPKWIKQHLPWACQVGIRELDAAADDPGTQLFLVSSYKPERATGLKPFDHETLWPLGEPVDVAPIARQLFSLTSLRSWACIIDHCKSFGWMVEEEDQEAGGAWFVINGGLRLYVDAGRETGRPLAFAVIFYFDEVGPEMAEFRSPGRADYDDAFQKTELTLRLLLGAPAAHGKFRHSYRPEWPYLYSIWRGEAGVLILRQDELDIQFGMDINVWVQPWNPGDPLPVPPIDL